MSIFLKQIYRAVFRGPQYILIKSLAVFVTGDVVYAQTCGVLTLKNLIEPPKTQVFGGFKFTVPQRNRAILFRSPG